MSYSLEEGFKSVMYRCTHNTRADVQLDVNKKYTT